MLRITVDIFPGGDPARRRTLATMSIANLSDLAQTSDYGVDASEAANHLAGTPARTCCIRLSAHDRNQSVWAIVSAAAAAVCGEDIDWIDW